MPRLSLTHVLDCSYVKVCVGGECGYIRHSEVRERIEELELTGLGEEVVLTVGAVEYIANIEELKEALVNSYRACKRKAVRLGVRAEEGEGLSPEEEEAVEELAPED